MHCKDEPVRELLVNDRPFKIPRYQRAYAWGDSHLTDFVDDIRRTVAELEEAVGGTPFGHFFGAVVSVRNPPPDDRDLSIIDGQQRLTTIFLAFRGLERELRHLADDTKNEDADLAERAAAEAQLLSENFLKFKRIVDGQLQSVPRLKLSEVDSEFFEQLVECESLGSKPPESLLNAEKEYERDSHERLYKAAIHLRGAERKDGADGLIYPTRYEADGVTDSNAADRLNRLLAIKNVLADHCSVVHIQTTNRDEANRLFVTLNDRGMDLSDSDLLRTETLSLTEGDDNLQRKVAGYWDKMLDQDGPYIAGFLKHYYCSLTGRNAPTKNKWRNYVQESLEDGRPPLRDQQPSEVCSFVKRMHDEEHIYAQICKAEWPFENAAAPLWDTCQLGHVVTPSGLGHTAAHPLLLAGVSLGEDQFSELLQLVGRFAFRYKNVCNGNISRPQKLYFENARAIRDGKYDFAKLQSDLQFELDRSAEDDVFKAQLGKRLNYDGGAAQKGNIKFFFSVINDYWTGLKAQAGVALAPQRDVVADWTQIDIEHIYPEAAQPPAWIIDEEMKARHHSFENLTLWWYPNNRAAGTKSFDDKKDSVNAEGQPVGYKYSDIAVTKDLCSYNTWGPAEMNQRHQKLVDFAVRVFVMKP